MFLGVGSINFNLSMYNCILDQLRSVSGICTNAVFVEDFFWLKKTIEAINTESF